MRCRAMLKAAVWTPLACSDVMRLSEVSAHYRQYDVVLLLPGTQRRAYDESVQVSDAPYHRAYQWGWRPSRYVNKSAGITMMLHKRYSREDVKTIDEPPRILAGRAVAMRVRRGGRDFLFLCAYYPPRSNSVEYAQTVDKITEWLHIVIAAALGRSKPLLGVDLNDGVGIEQLGGDEFRHVQSIALGPHGRDTQRYAGSRLVELAETHDLVFADALHEGAFPSYYGLTQTSFTICYCPGRRHSMFSSVLRVAFPCAAYSK